MKYLIIAIAPLLVTLLCWINVAIYRFPERIELIHIVNDSTVSVVTDKYAYDYMNVRDFQDYFDITLKINK